MDITAEQRKKLKSRGFLSNKDGKHFSARVLTRNGVLNASQLRNLSEAADKFGNGNVSFTSRLTVEIPGIKFEDVENFQKHISKENMLINSRSRRVDALTIVLNLILTTLVSSVTRILPEK
ncbi:MAG: hypothetical protein A2283_09655 [Lentisphaerae bacterium RIFOXYA12_FULL_48_11]|nr:MAG: hypothetical protein A2283_09655 [Lentisphaerae bacterium RIFOXYA12_FULL_48_11]